MQETQGTQVQSLGWEDPLEEEIATHSSILAWKIPGTEEPGGSNLPVSLSSVNQILLLYKLCVYKANQAT